MARYFVSYRRDDSAGHVGHLIRDLEEEFGREALFRDIDGIQPGEDFRGAIERELGRADAVLVVIGRRWIGPPGANRILDDDDLVRIEVATALRTLELSVIPVLVDGAKLPEAQQLPQDVQPLVQRQAIPLSERWWKNDVSQLSSRLRELSGEHGDLRPDDRDTARWRLVLLSATCVAVLVLLGAGLVLWPRADSGDVLTQTESIAPATQPAPTTQGDLEPTETTTAPSVASSSPATTGRITTPTSTTTASEASTSTTIDTRIPPGTIEDGAHVGFLIDHGSDWFSFDRADVAPDGSWINENRKVRTLPIAETLRIEIGSPIQVVVRTQRVVSVTQIDPPGEFDEHPLIPPGTIEDGIHYGYVDDQGPGWFSFDRADISPDGDWINVNPTIRQLPITGSLGFVDGTPIAIEVENQRVVRLWPNPEP